MAILCARPTPDSSIPLKDVVPARIKEPLGKELVLFILVMVNLDGNVPGILAGADRAQAVVTSEKFVLAHRKAAERIIILEVRKGVDEIHRHRIHQG